MPEAVIVGGGLAGSAAAIVLARAGREVLLLEKTTAATPKVCGEFLSASALQSLGQLGIAPLAHDGVPLQTFELSAGGAATQMPLGFSAVSLTREVLDEVMLEAAAGAGARVVRGATVTSVAGEGGDYRVEAGDAYRCKHLFMATGKSEVRGNRRGPGLHDQMVGLKRYAKLPSGAEAAPTIHIVLFPGGYCGIQPVEGQRLNICLAVSSNRLKAAGGPDGVFESVAGASKAAGQLLGGAEMDTRSFAVGRVPYGFIRSRTDGPFYLGDQAAVIPSFCGEGMGLALRSGVMAADALLAGHGAQTFQQNFAGLVGRRVRGTGLLSRAVCDPRFQPAAVMMARRAPWLVQRVSAHLRTPLPA